MVERSDAPLYNTAAVVKRTGVPAVTFRAWERRYGFPKPDRDTGGQRLYSEREITAIAWLAAQTARGVAISRAVAMVRGGHARTVEPIEGARMAVPRSYATVRRDLADALLVLDASRAERILSEAFGLFPIEDVCLEVLEPVLVDVGDRWHAGDLSVAEEHYVSSFVRARLFSLIRTYEATDLRGPLILTACAPNEWHEVGILLVSLFLARRGYVVRYLGPNLPLDGLSRLAMRHRPAVVVLSAQSAETARALTAANQVLEQGTGHAPRLLLGGQAFNDDADLRQALDGDYAGPNARATADLVDRLLSAPADRWAPREPVPIGLPRAAETVTGSASVASAAREPHRALEH